MGNVIMQSVIIQVMHSSPMTIINVPQHSVVCESYCQGKKKLRKIGKGKREGFKLQSLNNKPMSQFSNEMKSPVKAHFHRQSIVNKT